MHDERFVSNDRRVSWSKGSSASTLQSFSVFSHWWSQSWKEFGFVSIHMQVSKKPKEYIIEKASCESNIFPSRGKINRGLSGNMKRKSKRKQKVLSLKLVSVPLKPLSLLMLQATSFSLWLLLPWTPFVAISNLHDEILPISHVYGSFCPPGQLCTSLT